MANINDFKILNEKCLRYFDLVTQTIPFKKIVEDENLKKQFGFYFFILDMVCDERDFQTAIQCITDTMFNTYYRGEKIADEGVDMIYIDESNHSINLFNFKFNNKFSVHSQQSENDAYISTKLINAIIDSNSEIFKGNLKKQVESILNRFDSKETWSFYLFMVSNDICPIKINNSSLESLQNNFDLQIKTIVLQDIKDMMSLRPEPINASVMVDSDAVMPYSESNLSSFKSYILRLTSSEIIRITSDNKELRMQYNIENLCPLSEANLHFGVLFDNVRGFIKKSKYNNSIAETLEKEPSKFFLYNNGLTIVAKNINVEYTNGNKKAKIEINDFQVLNGGQTLRTLHDFNKRNTSNIQLNLTNSEILVRVFNITDDISINKIAEYTNSQNAISGIDLKSISSEQIEIEQYLSEKGIFYSRKSGDLGDINSTVKFKHQISMEKFGQILYSVQGYPEKSSTKKKDIFESLYSDIFKSEKFDITISDKLVTDYYEIINIYNKFKEKYQVIDQKVFYILYMNKFDISKTESNIHLLEKTLKQYRSNDGISDARKLLLLAFKNELIDKAQRAKKNIF